MTRDDNDAVRERGHAGLEDDAENVVELPAVTEAEFIRLARQRKGFDRGSDVEVGQAVIADLGGQSVVACADGSLYRYGPEGVWNRLRKEEVERVLHCYDKAFIVGGEKPKPLVLTQSRVNGARACAMSHAAQPDFFRQAPSGIAFRNGFVRVSSNGVQLLGHSPANRVTVGLPFAYDGRARCTRFSTALVEMFNEDPDAKEKIALLQEFIGACLIGVAPQYQVALVLVGVGANGKSVVLEVIGALFPSSAVVSIPPQDFGQEYRRALLANARVNLVNELPSRDVLESDSFKAVISGDLITGRPIREAPFNFRPIAGHIFAGNHLPGTSDQSYGFWRRLVVIMFGRKFSEQERDTNLAKKIIATELPGVTAWALEGAVRALRSGRYTIPMSATAARDAWQRNSDQVRLFVSDERMVALKLDAPAIAGIPAMDLYKRYERWSLANGHRPMASNKFGERMKAIGFEVKPTKACNLWRVEQGELPDEVPNA